MICRLVSDMLRHEYDHTLMRSFQMDLYVIVRVWRRGQYENYRPGT